jgi:hypothetical protein
MALQTKDAAASIDGVSAETAGQLAGDLVAGEAIAALDACCIRADGKVYRSNGTANDANARFDGFAPRAYVIGETMTLYNVGLRMRYGSAIAPAQRFYVAATAGQLDTAPTTGGLVEVARAINATDIRCVSAGA